MFIEKAKQLIDSHDVVSFDIFDTLLIRPYLRPADLFVHLEKLFKIPSFAKHRAAAETRARQKYAHLEDITLDEIYDELSGAEASLKAEELALERQTLQANPDMLEVFNYAKAQGKRIFVISDMYLPEKFLADVLAEKGFAGIEKVYVSNGPRKLKATGKLYAHVLQDAQLSPSRVLHIGDNEKSDVRRAREAGMDALLYTPLKEQFFKAFPSERKFWRANPSFEASVVLGVLALAWQKEMRSSARPGYFFRLGYRIGGATSYGFARWIEKQAKENHTPNLLFAARDGYTLARVFETFKNPDISSGYIYALRFLNRICRLDYHKGSQDQTQAVINHFKNKSPELAAVTPEKPLSAQEGHAFIQKYIHLIRPLAEEEFANYKKYLAGYIKHAGDVGIVDSITFSFSAQKLIEAVLGKESVVGYYWSVIPSSASTAYRYEHFLPETDRIEDSRVFTHRWDFMEFLFTAPEPPVKNITAKGEAVHAPHVPPEEERRIAAYRVLSDGMTAFAEDVYRIFGRKDIFLTAPFLINWLNWFFLHPTKEDTRQMAAIFHASDTNHQTYVPLLSYRPTAREAWGNLKEFIHFARRAYWKTPVQFLLTHVFSPLAVRKRGWRNVEVIFFPRLRKRYACLGVETERVSWKISWGRRGD